MSSFKKKGGAKTPAFHSYPGTKPSPASSSTIITSTGIPSLDDILGGGLPLSCSMLILAPDLHSSYGSLVQKYFVAEGLASGHRVIVVDSDPEGFVHDIMWYPKSYATVESSSSRGTRNGLDSEDEEKTKDKDQKIKIAWRYEQMKQFQTSVESPSLYVSLIFVLEQGITEHMEHSFRNRSSEGYCHTFDLSMRIPNSVIEAVLQAGKLICLKIARRADQPYEVLCRLSETLKSKEVENTPIRVCIPSLGSPFWGSLTSQVISNVSVPTSLD
jgi:elongator complex protein 4